MCTYKGIIIHSAWNTSPARDLVWIICVQKSDKNLKNKLLFSMFTNRKLLMTADSSLLIYLKVDEEFCHSGKVYLYIQPL